MWVGPKFVATVPADEITRSPVHAAAQDGQGRGPAPRFPRVVGFVREDKSAEDAATTGEIAGDVRAAAKGREQGVSARRGEPPSYFPAF